MDIVKLKILNFFVTQHLDRASRFYYTLSVLGYIVHTIQIVIHWERRRDLDCY